MNVRAEVRALREALEAEGTPERAEHERRYLKSSLHFFGASLPKVEQITRTWLRAHPGLSREELLGVVDAAWGAGVHELRALAIELLEQRHALLLDVDMVLLEQLLRTSGTWAYVDALAAHVVGPLVERSAAARRRLSSWAKDEDFWIRRAAMLALLVPLRRGEGDFELFTRFAVPQLGDTEFFIRKAIGWVLRATAKKTPERTIGFVEAHAAQLSGLTFREATRNLSEGERQRLQALRDAVRQPKEFP